MESCQNTSVLAKFGMNNSQDNPLILTLSTLYKGQRDTLTKPFRQTKLMQMVILGTVESDYHKIRIIFPFLITWQCYLAKSC